MGRARAVERDDDRGHLHDRAVHRRVSADRHLTAAAETHDDGAFGSKRRRRGGDR